MRVALFSVAFCSEAAVDVSLRTAGSQLGDYDDDDLRLNDIDDDVLAQRPRLCDARLRCPAVSDVSPESKVRCVRYLLVVPFVASCAEDIVLNIRGARGYRGLVSTGSILSDLIPWAIPGVSAGRNQKWNKKYSGERHASTCCGRSFSDCFDCRF